MLRQGIFSSSNDDTPPVCIERQHRKRTRYLRESHIHLTEVR